MKMTELLPLKVYPFTLVNMRFSHAQSSMLIDKDQSGSVWFAKINPVIMAINGEMYALKLVHVSSFLYVGMCVSNMTQVLLQWKLPERNFTCMTSNLQVSIKRIK